MQCNTLNDLFALYNCRIVVNIMQGNESFLSVNIYPLPQEQHFFFCCHTEDGYKAFEQFPIALLVIVYSQYGNCNIWATKTVES